MVPPTGRAHIIGKELPVPSFSLGKERAHWTMCPTFCLFGGLPERPISVPPLSQCQWDPAYSRCLESAKNKRAQGPAAATEDVWYSRQADMAQCLLPQGEREEGSVCPTFQLFRGLLEELAFVSFVSEHGQDATCSRYLGTDAID